MSRIAEIQKALKNAPKDRQGGQTYFSSEDWEVIDETYQSGTSLNTIYELLPEPKNKTARAFQQSYRNWKKTQTKA